MHKALLIFAGLGESSGSDLSLRGAIMPAIAELPLSCTITLRSTTDGDNDLPIAARDFKPRFWRGRQSGSSADRVPASEHR
jgi:hypothetical protein